MIENKAMVIKSNDQRSSSESDVVQIPIQPLPEQAGLPPRGPRSRHMEFAWVDPHGGHRGQRHGDRAILIFVVGILSKFKNLIVCKGIRYPDTIFSFPVFIFVSHLAEYPFGYLLPFLDFESENWSDKYMFWVSSWNFLLFFSNFKNSIPAFPSPFSFYPHDCQSFGQILSEKRTKKAFRSSSCAKDDCSDRSLAKCLQPRGSSELWP